uniref:Presenilin n=1 Tax=Panagrolaimus davidi TaxID=227884 RepID=A0A914R2G7_9BILA
MDGIWIERIEKWRHEILQTKRILIPVISNLLLTLTGWYFVYNCETDPNSLAYYLLDSRHNFTTGSDLYDGALNGVICVSLLAFMSFFMLLVAIYNFKRLIKAWLSISCLLIIFGISALFARDVFIKIGITEYLWIWTIAASGIYGIGGVAVFFSEKFPLWLHQFYVVTNCAIVSLYYLRMLPAHTTWFLLCAITLWDAFAVLAPQGPLNLITGCAENYSDNVNSSIFNVYC